MSLTKVSFSMINGASVNVLDFGAVGDDSTNDTAAFAAAIAYAQANNMELVIPQRTYLLTSGVLNFAAENFRVRGLGKPTLHFTGTGKGLELIPAVGADYYYNMSLENIIVKGGAGITTGVYAEGFVFGTMRNIEVHEVTNRGFEIIGCVATLFDTLKYSVSYDTLKATYGIYIAGVPATAVNYTADCTFLNCTSENFPGTGVVLYEASGNTFIGGTYEGLYSGLSIGPGCRLNNFDGVWFELNTQYDVEVAGASNSFNNCNLSSASSILNLQVTTGKNTTVKGGYVRAAQLQSTSADTLFIGCAFDQNTGGGLGIQGNGTYKCLGLTKTDNNGDIVGTMPDVLGESGSFTGTATGLTTTETGTIYYSKVGNQVTLRLPQFAGTSNATTFTITGMPAAIRPSYTETCLVRVRDNGGTITVGYAEILSTGVIQLSPTPGSTSSNWTASGSKAVYAADITYYY